MNYVIVGDGPAGVTAAETLRRLNPQAAVSLIGGEAGPPYSRMAIPYFLAGNIAEAGTYFRRAADHFERLGIQHVSDRVEEVSAGARRLRLAGGKTLAYDRLLVATGSRPALLPVSGLDTEGVYPCWTLADARHIAERARAGSEVVLIGAGFVACIIMQALAKRGMKLTVVTGSSGRMVRSMMNETAGGLIMRWCREHGVTIMTGQRVASIEGGPTVVLADGAALKADLVVVASGVKPNTEFAAAAGADTAEGIVVDEFLKTSLDDIFAAGDVAQGPDFSTRTRSIHAIQPTATEHGRIAAMNMTGRSVAYRGSLGMNVLDTLGLISSSFGQWQGVEGGDAAVHLDEEHFRYMDLRFDGDRLIGVNSVGRTENLGALRGLIQNRVALGPWKDKLMANPYRFMEAMVARTV